jgi:Flp pilus assembly protein TadG
MFGLFKSFRQEQNGQSAVEFALVLPLLVLIMLLIVEFGRVWMTVNVMTSAAREGARVASITAPDYARVNSAAQSVFTASQITGASVAVSGPNSNGDVQVTINLTYVPISGTFIPQLQGLQLSRSATMHWEN